MDHRQRVEHDRQERDLRSHRQAIEAEARRQTALMVDANRLAEKRTSEASSATGSGGGDPIIGMIAIAVIAVIAIVVTYWKEILLIGLTVLAVRYRHPLLIFVRRIASWFHQQGRRTVDLLQRHKSESEAQKDSYYAYM